jgi:hypothetical protein
MFFSNQIMQLFFIVIFLSISIIQTLDYDIDNRQICTHKPFTVNFRHNCSRTRLLQDVTIPNIDQDLYISIIINRRSSANTSFIVTKSVNYHQQVHFTFITFGGQYLYINNKMMIQLNDTSINTIVYDSSYEQFTQTSESPIPIEYLISNPFCLLKQTQFLPVEQISRIYYLYTDEIDLEIDLSSSTYQISPSFIGFDTCFTTVSSLTPVAIVLIVIVTVLSVITTVLILFCLKRQITQLYHIWINWIRARRGLLPTNTIHATPSS